MKSVISLRRFSWSLLLLGLAELAFVASFGFIPQISNLLLPKAPRYALALGDETAKSFWEATSIPTAQYDIEQLPSSELRVRLEEAEIRTPRFRQFRQYREANRLSPGFIRINQVLTRATICSEFIFSEQDQTLLVVHFERAAPTIQRRIELTARPARKRYGQSCVGWFSIRDAGLLDFKSYPLRQLDWRSTKPVDLGELNIEFPRIISARERMGTLSFLDSLFQERVRDRVSGYFRLKLALLRFCGMPLGLSMCGLAAFTMRRAYLAYIGQGILELVCICRREFGSKISISIPSFRQFCLEQDLIAFHEATVARLRHLRRTTADRVRRQRTEENLNQRLIGARQRMQSNPRAVALVDQALASTSLEFKKQALARIANLGTEPNRPSNLARSGSGSGGKTGRVPRKGAATAPLVSSGGLTRDVMLKLEQKFRSSFSQDQLASLLPPDIPHEMVQVIVFALMSPGEGGSRFKARYLPKIGVVKTVWRKHLSWFGQPIDESTYARTLHWLQKKGVILKLHKPRLRYRMGGWMLSLETQTTNGADEVGQRLIGLVLRCAAELRKQ